MHKFLLQNAPQNHAMDILVFLGVVTQLATMWNYGAVVDARLGIME